MSQDIPHSDNRRSQDVTSVMPKAAKPHGHHTSCATGGSSLNLGVPSGAAGVFT